VLKDDVKVALRLKTGAFDNEVLGLIAAAKADLRLAGVVFDDLDETETTDGENVSETITNGYDPLIKMAIILYCKTHFGQHDPQGRFLNAYLYQKRALCLAGDYNAVE